MVLIFTCLIINLISAYRIKCDIYYNGLYVLETSITSMSEKKEN